MSTTNRVRLHALLPAEVAGMLDQLAAHTCADRTATVVSAIVAAWEAQFPEAAAKRRKEAAHG